MEAFLSAIPCWICPSICPGVPQSVPQSAPASLNLPLNLPRRPSICPPTCLVSNILCNSAPPFRLDNQRGYFGEEGPPLRRRRRRGNASFRKMGNVITPLAPSLAQPKPRGSHRCSENFTRVPGGGLPASGRLARARGRRPSLSDRRLPELSPPKLWRPRPLSSRPLGSRPGKGGLPPSPPKLWRPPPLSSPPLLGGSQEKPGCPVTRKAVPAHARVTRDTQGSTADLGKSRGTR